MDVSLREIEINDEHEWCNKTLGQVNVSKNMIVLMVKRDQKVIIPDGNTLLQKNDLIVTFLKNANI